jgi:hypothetical protein
VLRPQRLTADVAPTPRWVVPLLFFVLLMVGFAAGIWGTWRAIYPGPGLHRVTGVFEARAGDTLMIVNHDPAPGLMDEMVNMAFFAETKEMLDAAGLQPGDRVRLTVRQLPDRYLVVEVRKIQ